MFEDEEPSLRQQLAEARAKIVNQLDELRFRVERRAPMGEYRLPNYRDVFAALEAELREIDELLRADGPDRP